MFKIAKHFKELPNKKRIKILLSVLAICLLLVGTVLGKYIIDKTLDNKIKLNIAGTPQGNVLIGDGKFENQYTEDYGFVPTAGFAYQLQQLMENNGKTLGDLTKLVFDTEVPSGIDKATTATKIDVSHGGKEKIFAYYDSNVDANTVYVVPEQLPTDGVSYPMMANENAVAMFAGLYKLDTIEGLENVFLGNITDANNMFLDCRALTAVDLSHWTAENLTDMHYMFAYCYSLKSLDLTSFNTVNVIDMSSAFWECEALETIELDKEKFVTDNVTNMSGMFGNCYSLKAIDVSGFNTKNVQYMSSMFAGCESLKNIDVTGFDTSSVETIYSMFQGCTLLETIDVSGFNIDKVTDLSDMFLGCETLKTVDLSEWNTSGVTSLWRMFQNCYSMTELDLSSFDTSNVENMSGMFWGCQNLTELDLWGWNTEKVTSMSFMFGTCSNLYELNLASFNTSNVVTMHQMFYQCNYLTTIYVSKDWTTDALVNAEQNDDGYIDEFEGGGYDLFDDCDYLVGGQGTAYSDISDEFSANYDAEYNNKKFACIDKAQELQQDGTYGEKGYLTLYEAYTLKEGSDFNKIITDLQAANPAATSIVFGSYNELKSGLGNLDWNDTAVSYQIVDSENAGTIRAYVITDDYDDTSIYVVSQNSSVIFANQDCSWMFDYMYWLTYIGGLENVDTRNTINMSYMFSDCWELWSVNVSKFDTGKVTDMSGMFNACKTLDSYSLDVSGFDTANVTNMYGMFANCQSLYDLDVSGFDTSNVNNMGSMFASCTNLYELNLSGFDTANVTNMASMFDDCTSLETIYAGAGWNTDKVTDHNLMFDNCTVLVGGQGTKFDENYIDKTYALIDAAREPNGAKGYLTDADYAAKSKILLPGDEVNAELKKLLEANESVTKVQFGEASQFSEELGFDYWDGEAWTANADAVLDVARSGNISAFVVGDTVYILAKEVDYGEQGSVIYANVDCAEMFRHNVDDETEYLPAGRLTAIDGLYIVDTGNTTDMSSMFRGSSNLATVDLSGFNTANVTNMEYMFYDCSNLGGLNLSSFNTGKVTNMNSMFYNCDSVTALNLSRWDVRKVTNMNSMFYDCDKLKTLNLTGWNTSNVTDMTAMFFDNSKLTTVYVDESWKTGRVESSKDMFTGCTAIVGGQGTTFDEDYTDKEYAVIDKLVSEGVSGYLTYEEAYTLVSGPDFNWMLWDGNGDYGNLQWTVWNSTLQEYVAWDGADIRITEIVFGSFDEYKETLGLTSWDEVAPGLALDDEQQGNIRLYIPGYDWSKSPEEFNDENDNEPDDGEYGQVYYVLSKGDSKIIANEDSSAMLRTNWQYVYESMWLTETELTKIGGLDKLDTRYVTDMSQMFNYYHGEALDLSSFDTSNVTDMSGMFYECINLTSLNLTGFDTSNVTDMSAMFDGNYNACSSLETLDLSMFDTSKVTNMNNMFNGMTALTNLNISSFDTSKVTDMSYMFASVGLQSLDLSHFDTSSVTDMNNMFYYCDNLTDLDISSFNTSKVNNMQSMFSYCHAIKLIDISSFSTDSSPNISQMFFDCIELLTILATDEWDHEKVTYGGDYYNTSDVFALDDQYHSNYVSNLTGGEGTKWADTAQNNSSGDYAYARLDKAVSVGTEQQGLFTDKNVAPTGDFTLMTGTSFNSVVRDLIIDSSATKLQFGAWDTYGSGYKWSQGTDVGEAANTIKAFVGESDNTIYILSAGNMFANADSSNMFRNESSADETTYIPYQALTAINGLANVNTSRVTNMQYMFAGCSKLTSLDVSSFNTSNVTDMKYMFDYCSGLTSLDVSSFNTANVTDMRFMFNYCSGLTLLDISDFSTANVTNMRNMFNYCSNLTLLDLSSFDTAQVTNVMCMFRYCSNLTSLDLSSFDTANVTTMSYMFENCSSLTSLDLSSFDTANVTAMYYMFLDCSSLTSLDLSSFDTAKVTNMNSMFKGCLNLKTIYADDSWDVTNVSSSSGMFTGCTALVGGEGTEFSSSYTNKTYARIDKAISEGVKGYLTDPSAPKVAMLTTGASFSSTIKDLFSDTVTKIQFGTYNEFADTVGDWSSSSTYVDIDNDGDGTADGLIRVFTNETTGTVYVLSEGDRLMYANANSSNMFRHNYSTTTGYIPSGALTAIGGLSSVNTSRVTNMQYMFYNCYSLTELDVSGFNTENVTNMQYMFFRCNGLTELDVSSFNTENVTYMYGMFHSCSGLTVLDLTSFNTAKVGDMQFMFYQCSDLATILVDSDWSTDKVTSSGSMFYNCNEIVGGKGTTYNSSNIDATYARIDGGPGSTTPGYLTDINLVDEYTLVPGYAFNSKVTALLSANADVTKLQFGTATQYGTSAGYASWDEGVVLDIWGNGTIRGFANGDTVYILTSGNEMSASPSMYHMFSNMSKLTSINGIELLDTSNVGDMSYMFDDCSSLTELDLTSFNTANVTKMSYMFNGCSELTMLDVSNFDTTNVTGMSSMFYNCSKLTSLDVSSFNTAKVTGMSFMFQGCSGLTSLDLSSFNTENVMYMQQMFYKCSGLTELKLSSSFNTANVTNMLRMFYYCSKLTSLDLSSFNTANVTDMRYMFSECSGLTELKLSSSFNTANVTDMTHMFSYCSSLTSLDVSSFNTAKVGSMDYMFNSCSSLTSLDLSSFNTANVTSMYCMFNYCTGLTELKLSSTFSTAKVTTMYWMFRNCSSLTSLDLSSFDTAKVTNMSQMFYSCSKLATILVDSDWTTNKVTSSTNMFYNCIRLVGGKGTKYSSSNVDKPYARIDGGPDSDTPGYLTDINLVDDYTLVPGYAFNSKVTALLSANTSVTKLQFGTATQYGTSAGYASWDEGVVLDIYGNGTIRGFASGDTVYILTSGNEMSASPSMYYMFRGMSQLTSINGMELLDTSNVVDMSYMFYNMSKLTSINGIELLDTSNVVDMSCMFQFCKSLTSLDLSSFDTAKVTDMYSMFYHCNGLTSLVFPESFNTANVTDMRNMFYKCSGLKSVVFPKSFNTANVTDMNNMFYHCNGLTSLDLSSFNTAKVTSMYCMFQDCSGLTSLDLSSFNTVNVTNMNNMFQNCSSLTSLEFPESFNTANVTGMGYMFSGCSKLTSLDLSSFNTANVTDVRYMFYNCSKLTTIWVNSDWSTEKVSLSTGMFSGCSAIVGGKGTTYNASNINATYARIDGGPGSDTPGYLTYRVSTTYMLASGSDFNSKITALLSANTDVTKLQFGTNEQYATAAGYASWENGVVLDVTNSGTVRAFVNGDTVYILTSGKELIANADSSNMFSGMSAITSIDAELLYTANVTNMNNMFNGCSSLKAIYVGDDWSTTSVESGDGMFSGCTVLQGGAGTKYSDSNIDHTYARVDYAATPGYLTLKSEAAPTGEFTLMTGSNFKSAVSPLITNFGATKLQFGSWADYGLVNGFSWQQGLDVSATGDGSIRAFHGDTVYILSGGSMAANAEASYMFDAMSALTAIDGFEYVDMSSVTTMHCMFRGCSGLLSLDLSSFDVSEVTAMSYMFEGLTSLTNLELSMKNASKVQTMTGMFLNSTGLQSVKFTGLNTTALENVSTMFSGCSGLTSVDLSGLNTSSVTTMSNMFLSCSSLANVDLSVLDTGNVTTMDHLFKNCTSLTSVTFPADTSKLTDVNFMFETCSALKSIDLSSFDTSAVTNMSGMFYNSGLTEFDLTTLDTSSATNMSRMFESCASLVTVYFSNNGVKADISKVTTMEKMFYSSGVQTIDLSGLSAPSLTTMSEMFRGSKVQNANFTGLQASKLTNMSYMFYGCSSSSLTINFTNSVTSVTNMSYMFYGCTSLTSFSITGLDTSKVTDMSYMFRYCSSLSTIDISSFNTANVTNMTGMFQNCSSLTTIYGGKTNWNTGKVTSSGQMFGYCDALHNKYDSWIYDVSGAAEYVTLK